MSSPLSGIAPHKRRQLAATLGLFAVLFVAVGAVAATGATTGVVKTFVAIALVVAVFLGLFAWGVAHSLKEDLADAHLDAAIERAVTARGDRMCDCGHDHDPTEMHFVADEDEQHVGDPCDHDGAGTTCTHSCDTCVLAALRPAEVASAAHRRSPRPRRPSPTPR